MKRLKMILMFTFFSIMFMLGKNNVYAADFTISYQRIDPNGEAISVTDLSSDTDFTNANAALSSEVVVAYLYDTCRYAYAPSVATSDMTITVVTETEVGSNHGTFSGVSDAVWFIYDNKLYITGATSTGGAVTITDSSANHGIADLTQSLTGTTSEIYYPSFFYSDLDGNGSGIQDSYVGDEKDFSETEFYKFTDTTEDTYDETLGERESITMSSVRLDVHQSGLLAPSSAAGVPWYESASTITDVYISDDIALSGNMAGLFNGACPVYIKNSGDEDNDMGDSIYAALKNVYLYCDMSNVTSTAGMFARCSALENIYVRTGETSPLTNVKSTAYMFYGDTLLTNGTDSFINAMDLSASSNLVSTAFMFGGCETIATPNVSSYYMDNVEWADGMFFGAKNARLVSDSSSSATCNIYNWNLSNVKNASVMFSGGDADGVIDLDDPTASMDPGLSEISDYGNVIVGTVDMSNWNMDACLMTSMMFSRNGSEFVGVVLDDSYTALIDASGMFLRCDYLVNATMNSSMPALKNATSMFKHAGKNTTVATANVSGWNAPVLINADLMFYDTGFITIDTSNISDLSTLVSAVGMFGHNTLLSSLGDGALNSVTFGALENAKMMFIDDVALVALDSSRFNMATVEDLSFFAQNTTALSSGFDISNWGVGASLTNMECFADGNGMASFDYSDWDSRNVTNWAFAFANNDNVTSITPATSSYSLYNAQTLMGAFANNPSLTTVGTMPSSTNLVDASGLFANDSALTSVDIADLIGTKTTNISYLMKNCSAITSVDISGWNSVNVVYMQGAFDGDSHLVTLTLGGTFSGKSAIDTGTMFRDNHVLPSSTVATVLSSFTSGTLTDAYEMLKNCYKLTTLDMSSMNLSATTDLRRFACMEEDSSYTTNNLTKILLPQTILTADGVMLKDTDGTSINMFYVPGNETSSTDDLVTTLFIDGTPGTNILAYNFGGTNGDNDNRSFVTYNARTINGNGVGTYVISDEDDKAVMAIDANSSLYTGGTTTGTATLVPLAYSWTKDGSSIAGADGASYTSSASGTYVATAYPSTLKGNNTSVSASFLLGASIEGIEAEYTGDNVTVGNKYSLDDLVVTLVDTDGNEVVLTSDDYTVNSQTVTKTGDNTFTVTYKSGDDTYTATFTVKGVRNIGSVTATYTGPSVIVGKNYDSSYVKMTAYYSDDTSKTSGFTVTPSSFSSETVSSAGDNTFTAYYYDSAQDKTFSGTFTVNGYKPISYIKANYTGNSIEVGKNYNTDDVKVTLYYTDGTSATTSNFSVNSQTVTYEGGNSFTASYRDPFGNVYTAGFNVTGYANSSSATASASSTTGPTASSVSAPTYTTVSSTTAAGKTTGTSTGVVQTGTTGKAVLYLTAILVLILAIGVAVYIRKKQGRQ